MTILERAMTAWHLVDITPPRTSQEAEETKEKWKRKVQITFPAPGVKFRCPMLAFWLFEYLIHFWSYQACDYTIMKPRTWPTCWSSSDENRLSSHGDIHPTIQTFISLVTMEPASLLACYSAIAADHDYTLLEGQPLSQLPDTSWYCSPNPLCSRSVHPPQSPVLHFLWSSQVYHQAWEVLSGCHCVPWTHCLWSLSPMPLVGGSYSKCSTHHAYIITVVNFPSHLVVHLSDFQVYWGEYTYSISLLLMY